MSASRARDAERRVSDALSRIEIRDSDLRAVTALARARAFELASRASQRAADQEGLHPIDGIILAVKDNIAVKNLPWTAGLGAWKSRTAIADARVVQRLAELGAIPLAMVNMDEGALGATTDNPHFGRTRNPLDPDRTPGGSSGGSAAAVSAGYVDAALGSDTMGSVRIPAAYCGIVGLKPSRGLIPRSGLARLSPTLDTIGPIARNVATVGRIVSAMAGPDDDDPHSLPAPPNWQAHSAQQDVAGLRIGIPKQIGDVDCEAEILRGLNIAISKLEALGCAVSEIDIRGWSPGHARRGGLMVCEAEGAVELADALRISGADAVSSKLRVMLRYGQNLKSDRLTDGYARIQNAAAAAERALAGCDAILMPTAPQRAFLHGVDAPDNQADFTSLANFHGGPALAVPVPTNGLPASVQILGRQFSEALVLRLGERLESALAD